jgi:hypothetical protein
MSRFPTFVFGLSLHVLSSVARQIAASTQTGSDTWTSLRTPWGDPDLQGLWTNIRESRTPFERPPELANVGLATRRILA